MHHSTRYDNLDHLKAELEQEKRYRETIEWSNTELERSIGELESYLQELDSNTRGVDDNEWKVRFESQTALNKQLAEQKEWLETELIEARRKLTTGSYPEAMNFNLDALNESELLRLVKHLERMRNDFYSTLRDTEWKLDKESKEFHHFDEMRRVYRVDLKHANQTIERLRVAQLLDTSGIISPVYPSGGGGGGGGGGGAGMGGMGGGPGMQNQGGYGRYRDEMTGRAPSRTYGDIGGMKGGGGGGGIGGGKKGGKSPGGTLDRSLSPQRSKSRADKKTKKKDDPSSEDPDHLNAGDLGGSEPGGASNTEPLEK